ncbi:MAG: PhzF family phenazine biosynthesis protein [Actinomycetota bacterium]
MPRRFTQVDVFTDRLGYGNPLAVVLDGEGLADESLAVFARWTNLSETTFVLPPLDPAADYRVRIFTPSEELPFAGHPTIGTCHAWLEAGGTPKTPGVIVQECGVGLVELRQSGDALRFATPPLMRSGPVDAHDLAHAADALGLAPDEILDSAWIDNGPGWLGIRIGTTERLAELAPNLDPADKYGVVALTGGDDPALVVRAFFHADGTREDPVTGSLNGSVAQWLLGNATITAPYRSSQGTAIGRDGRIEISEADGEIWVGGSAVTGITGTVDL